MTPPQTRSESLAAEQPRRSIGVLGIVFFVVAAAAPIVGMTGAVPVSIVLGNGAAVPGTFVIIGLVLILFSVGYSRMSRDVTNAGAFFAYVAHGLGNAAGIGAAFVSVLAYVAVQLAGFGFVGALLSSHIASSFGLNLPWWAWAAAIWAVVTVLSALSIDVGARILGVLMAVELLSLVVTAIAVFAKSPGSVDLGASFSPSAVFAGGLTGSAGIALAFALASFLGFEATAIYAAEAKDPDRTVGRATYVAVLTIAAVFAISSLGVIAGLGDSANVVQTTIKASSVGGQALADPSAVLFGVARQYVGPWMADLMGWLLVSSMFAGALAFQNAIARYLRALSTAGVLPARLGRLNTRGAPASASVITSLTTALVMLIFAVARLDPVVDLFYWFSGMAVIAILLVEILVSVAVVRYFRARRDAGRWQTMIAPVLAAVLLAFGLYLLAARFGLLAGTASSGADPSQDSWALSPTGWALLGAPFATFAIAAVVARARRTEALDVTAP